MNKKMYCLFFIGFAFSMSASAKELPPANQGFFSDSLQVKIYSKGKTIKLYTTASSSSINNNGSNQTENLHFYVFDLAGTLVHQATLKGSIKHTLPSLRKGIYLYDVFKDDESIEDGKIVVQ